MGLLGAFRCHAGCCNLSGPLLDTYTTVVGLAAASFTQKLARTRQEGPAVT